jgi:hypothetical protein
MSLQQQARLWGVTAAVAVPTLIASLECCPCKVLKRRRASSRSFVAVSRSLYSFFFLPDVDICRLRAMPSHTALRQDDGSNYIMISDKTFVVSIHR